MTTLPLDARFHVIPEDSGYKTMMEAVFDADGLVVRARQRNLFNDMLGSWTDRDNIDARVLEKVEREFKDWQRFQEGA